MQTTQITFRGIEFSIDYEYSPYSPPTLEDFEKDEVIEIHGMLFNGICIFELFQDHEDEDEIKELIKETFEEEGEEIEAEEQKEQL